MAQVPINFVFDIDEASASRVKQKITDVSTITGGGDMGAPLAKNVREAREQADKFASSLKNVRVGVGHTSSGLKNLGLDVRNLNKNTASANQTIFAFSDIVQDSTQFTQGFSQGMRAIGNNVAFTAELFGNLKNRVDIYNESILAAGGTQKDLITVSGQLRKSLTGVGGVLIAINSAFIVGQIFADRQRREYKKIEEQAKATAEAISEVAQSFSELDTGVVDPFGMRKRQRAIESLEKQLIGFSEKQVAATLTMDAFSGASQKTQEAVDAFSQTVQKTPENIDKFGQAIRFLFGLDNTSGGRALIKGAQAYSDAINNYDQTIKSLTESEDLPLFVRELIEMNNQMTLSDVKSFNLKEEMKELGQVIGDDAASSLEKFAENANQFLQNPIDNLIKAFPNLSFEAAKFFGKISEKDIIRFESLRELRKETEKLRIQQEAYTNFLNQEANIGLRDYVNTMADAERVIAKLSSDTVFTSLKGFTGLGKARQDIIESIKAQIVEVRNEIRVMEQRNSNLDEEFLLMQGTNTEYNEAISLLSKLASAYDFLNDPVESASIKVEDLTNRYTAFLTESQKIDIQTTKTIDELEKLKDSFPELATEIDNAIRKFIEYQKVSKISTQFEELSDFAAAMGELGEIFNASKEFRIAMAAIDGGAAIIGALADPSLGFFGKLAAAATISARVYKQIEQMKNVEIGSSGSFGRAGGTSGVSPITSTSTGMQPTQSISFLPNSATSGGAPPTVDVKIDRAGLAVAVNKGNRELANKQVRV